MKRVARFMAVGIGLALVACSTRAADVEVETDVRYGTGDGQPLLMDVARPKDGAAARPCILFVHGGGWSKGDKSGHAAGIRLAAARGFVAASCDYRLLPKYHFPAQVQDVKAAVRFLRANAAKYGIDPERIGAAGDSAGGHLVLMLAVTRPEDGLEGDGGNGGVSSAVQAVVSFYGPTDLGAADLPAGSRTIVGQFLGTSGEPGADLVRKASPVAYVHAGEPPVLLLQGTADPLVPATQAFTMIRAMTKAKAPGRAEFFANAGHGFVGDDLLHAVDAAMAFFEQHLRPRQAKD